MSELEPGQKVTALIDGEPKECEWVQPSSNKKRHIVRYEGMQYETDLLSDDDDEPTTTTVEPEPEPTTESEPEKPAKTTKKKRAKKQK